MRINLISTDNKGGLTQDANIITHVLTGHDIKFYDIWKYTQPEKADINIFLEHLDARYIKYGQKNYLIPNPEWFNRAWLKELPKMDEIWCKTQDAVRIFSSLGYKTRFISFSSFDRTNVRIKRSPVFLHVAGHSETKGTQEIVQCWERHPDLPQLILTNRKPMRHLSEVPNMTVLDCEFKPQEITNLMNYAKFHLCPSLYEGFGHYINEARSVGAIIFTTDAPPMNELVTKDFGFLVRVKKYSRQNMGRLNYIDPEDLYQKVMTAISLSDETLHNMALESARAYTINHQFFRKTLREAIYE